MKTKYRTRVKKTISFDSVTVDFTNDITGKAVVIIKQNDRTVREEKVTGSKAVVPLSDIADDSYYDIDLKIAEDMWNEKTYNNITITTS